MKRILQIGMTSNYGGVETFIMNLYRHIDRTKFQFDFLDMENNGKEIAYTDEIKKLGGNIYKIPGRKENWIKNYRELKKLIKTNHYYAIHNNVLTWSYIDGISLPLKYSKAKVIVHSHNSKMDKSLLTRRLLNAINRRYNHSDDIIRLACSKDAGKWLFDDKQFQVIPNGIDCNSYKFREQIRSEYRKKFKVDNQRVFLNVGRLSYQKNQTYLLKLFKKICEKESNAILFLAGDGELKEQLMKEALALGISKKVKFLGIRHDIKELMFMSDEFILTSHYEGLPLVLVEAQATGLPCLISDTISDEVNLTPLINKINIQTLTEEYASLALNLINSNENRMMSAQDVIQAGYDISNTVKTMERIYTN